MTKKEETNECKKQGYTRFNGIGMGMVCVLTVAAQEKPADNMQIVLEKVRANTRIENQGRYFNE